VIQKHRDAPRFAWPAAAVLIVVILFALTVVVAMLCFAAAIFIPLRSKAGRFVLSSPRGWYRNLQFDRP
jgi:hypothetical protein